MIGEIWGPGAGTAGRLFHLAQVLADFVQDRTTLEELSTAVADVERQRSPYTPLILGARSEVLAYREYFVALERTLEPAWRTVSSAGMKFGPLVTGNVHIETVLASDGTIASIVDVRGLEHPEARRLSEDFLRSNLGKSFGRWTPEMITALGPTTKVTFSFNFR